MNIRRINEVSLLILFCSVCCGGQVSVLTQHNDNARTGENVNETTLNTSNVSQSNFGKLFWRTVDGFIYTQPLYVPGLNIQGATHNVVYVATQHNSVYAFDADDPNAPAPLWQVNLGNPVPSQDICIITGDTNPSDCPYYDISPEIGITSTPVIDTYSQTGNATRASLACSLKRRRIARTRTVPTRGTAAMASTNVGSMPRACPAVNAARVMLTAAPSAR